METYNPSEKEIKLLQRVYKDISSMENERNKRYREFNDRTFKEYIDDSEKRVNCYVPAENDKEDWQANFSHPVTRNKLKAIIAAVALGLPTTEIKAQNENNSLDFKRADVMKHLVRFSYSQGNPEEDNFFLAWETASKGTAIEYEGYAINKYKRKEITSCDLVTGDVEWEEKEVVVEDGCVSFMIPLENIWVSDFYIRDIQKQPYLAWIDYMHVDTFNNEFGKYTNSKFVSGWKKEDKDDINKKIEQKSDNLIKDEELTFYTESWKKRVSDKDFVELVRYYNKDRDEYIILANGVMILNSPLLWGRSKKVYPFAKTINEPFRSNFFYGKSFPDLMMGEQDVIDSLYNMSVDKTFRSLVPPMLIGDANRDAFDLEDEEVTMDTKIYVSDIGQVKPMEIPGVSSADIKMIDIISRGLDLTSVDSNQQGIAGRGVTAREVVIANENAKRLKGILFMALSSMWVQKIRLRILNILTYYTLPKVKSIIGEDGQENKIDEYMKFIVDNTELQSGGTGTLGIQIVGSKDELPSQRSLDVEDKMYELQGKKHESIAITKDYLDGWEYDVSVTTDTLFNEEDSTSQAIMTEKIKIMALMFPALFQKNQVKLFRETVKSFSDDPDSYDLATEEPQPMEASAAGQPGMPTSNAKQMQGNAGAAPLPV